MTIPKEIEDLLHECNVYVNKDAVAVIQVQPRSNGVYDVYIYTVNGATISCILSKQERLALITTATEPIVNKR
jgi:hypothetical protein